MRSQAILAKEVTIIDSARFITGQAFVELAYAKEGTVIGVHQGGVMDRPAGLAKVVSRFAKL